MTLNPLTALTPQVAEHVVRGGQTGLPLAGANNPPYMAPVDLHHSLEEVRRMPEFQPPRPGLLDELLKQPWLKNLSQQIDHQLDSLLRQLAHFLSRLQPPGAAHLPENIREVFSLFVGFLIVMVSLYALYIVLGWLLRIKESRRPQPPPETRLFEQAQLVDSGFHYQQARQAAENSQYEEAIRQLYMATLCLLDEQAVAPYEAARSNLEYIALLAQSPSTHQQDLKLAFGRLASRFESSRYGGKSINQTQFEQGALDYEQIQQQTVNPHG